MAVQEVEMHIKPVIDSPTVRPGDKLLVRVSPSHGYTHRHFDELLADLKERLPGVEVCVLAADQLVVYRPDPEANRD